MGQNHQRMYTYVLHFMISALLFIPTAIPAPTHSSDSGCTAVCRPSRESNKLKYEEGKTYTYGFDTEVNTKLIGTSDEQSRIQIRGEALLAVKSLCEFVLTVQRSEITGPSHQVTEGIEALEGSSIRFFFQDGTVESVCVNPEDPAWSANIKRGLISLFQNKALDALSKVAVLETDVSGRCPTTYGVSGSTYTKTRNLATCTHRDGGLWILQGTPYQTSSEQNSIPALKSTQTCEQTLDHGLIKSIVCTDVHKLTAIAAGQGGAETRVVTRLRMKGTTAGIPTVRSSAADTRSTILYDHSKEDSTGHVTRLAIESTELLLANICSQTRTGTVTALVPGLMQSLRRALRSIHRVEALDQIWEKISSRRVCDNAVAVEKIFKSTLAKAGTTEAIVFMTKLIAQGKVDKKTQLVFSFYTSFAPRPAIAALAAFNTLLTRSEVDSEVVLAASGVAHRYCQEVDSECGSNDDYIRLINSISQLARESCMAQEDAAVNLGVTSLLALGNVDNLPAQAVRVISECIAASSRIGMTALESFRRHPCQPTLKRQALDIFKDSTQSSEFRIQAYLAVARCLKHDDVGEVQRILDTENSNQVGSFVSSHVANILSSPSPTKRNLRTVFHQLRLPKDFPSDPRKFSTNFDWATFSPAQNLGASSEANLIYSQDSYLPRLVTTNVEAQLFGRAYKFFEMGLYLEDFEHILEKYFGPKGKVSRSSRNDFLNSIKSYATDFKSMVASRFRRDVATSPAVNLNAIENKHIQAKSIRDRFGSNGIGDLYIRSLGTTILSKSFSQDKLRRLFVADSFNTRFDKFVQGAKDYNIEITEPITLLDDEFVVPTVAGLPLNLELQGTTVLSLQLSGKFDLRSFMNWDRNTDLRSRIIPSAATTVKAKMSVGSGPVESGLRLEGNLHAATGVDLALVRTDRKLEVQVNLPEDKVQVLGIRSELFWIESEKLVLKQTPLISKFASRDANTPVCSVSKTIGLQICARMQYPEYRMPGSPPFPFAGDAAIGMYIEKTEPSMEGYYFKIETNTQNGAEKEISIKFDTPGSTTKRTVTGVGRYQVGHSPKLDLDITTPNNRYKLEYKRWNEDDVKGIDFKVMKNNQEYSTSAKVKISRNGPNSISYEPTVVYKLDQRSGQLIQGKVTRDIGKQLDLDISYGNGLDRMYVGKVSGTIQIKEQNQRNVDYSLGSLKLESEAFGKLLLDGNLADKENSKGFNLVTKYGDQLEHSLTFNTELSYPTPKSHKMSLSMTSTRQEFLNFDLQYIDKRTENDGFENEFKFTRGINEASKFNLLQNFKVDYVSTNEFEISSKLSIAEPKRGVGFDVNALAKSTKDSKHIGQFDLRYGSRIRTTIKYNAQYSGLPNYDLLGEITLPGTSLKFNENAKKLDLKRWKYVTSLSCNRDGQKPFTFNADTDLSFTSNTDDMQSDIRSRIRISTFDEPFTLTSNVFNRKELYQARLKVSRTNDDILNLATEYRKATGNSPSQFSSKAYVHSYLDAMLEETHARGASNFRMETIWTPSGRKVVIGSNLSRQGETYNWDARCQWDALRDPRSSLTFQSTTKAAQARNDISIDSANVLTVLGEYHGLNFTTNLNSGDILNGEYSADISYASPEGHRYRYTGKSINENKEKVKSTLVELRVELPNQHPLELEFNSRAANIDPNRYMFDLASNFKLAYQGTKNIAVLAELGSVLTNKRSVSAVFDVSGTLISEPMRWDFNGEIQKGLIKTTGNAKIGSDIGNFLLEMNYDRWSPKKTMEVKYKLVSPFGSYQSSEANVKQSFFFTSWTNFEYLESGSITINNDRPSNWDAGIGYLGNDLQAKLNMNLDGQSIIAFSTKGVVGPKKFTIKVQNNYRNGGDIRINFDGDRNWPNIRFTINIATPYDGYEKLDMVVRHKVGTTVGKSYVTQIQGAINSERLTFTSEFELTDDKKYAQITYTNRNGVKKISGTVNGLRSSNYNIETMISWADNFISTKGNLLKSSAGIEGTLTLHSTAPGLKADNWNIKISNTASPSGGTLISARVQTAQKEIGSLVLEYAKKESSLLSIFDGSVAVRANSADWGGTFTFKDKVYTQSADREVGRGLTLSVQLKSDKYPVKLTFDGKDTSVGQLLSINFCSDGEEQDCKKTELARKFKTTAEEDNYEVSAIINSVSDGRTLSEGVVIKKMSRINPQTHQLVTFEHSIRFLTSENGNIDEHDSDHGVGYKVFVLEEISEPKVGLDIYLPERELSLLYTRRYRDVEEHLFEGWTNKLIKPDEKISLLVVNDRRDIYTIIFKLPSLRKDLQIRSKIQTNQNGHIIDSVTDLDFFKGSQPLSFILKVTKVSEEPRPLANTYAVDLGLKGLITLNTHSEITLGTGELLSKIKFEYVNREQELRNYDLVFDYGFNHRTLELVGPNGRIVFYSSRYTFHHFPGTERYDGYEVRREFFLPGMADSRIFQNSVTTSFPPSLHLKMYTANSPSGEFYEAWAGFRNDQHLGAGFYTNEGSHQSVLVDFNVALNNSRLLFIKSTWDRENIQKFLEKSNERFTDTAHRYKRIQSASLEYLQKEASHVRTVITKALPSLRPVFRYYKQEFEGLGSELNGHRIRHYVEFFLNIIGSDVEEFRRQLAYIKTAWINMFSRIEKAVEAIPDMLSYAIDSIPNFVKIMEESLGHGIDALTEFSNAAVKWIRTVFERVSTGNTGLASKLEFLSDTSKGIGKMLKEGLVDVVQRLAELWKFAEQKSEELLEMGMVRENLKRYAAKYQRLITNLIDDYKRDLESLRDSLLRALPDREVQELFQSIAEYVERKTRGESFNEEAAQSEIYSKFVRAVEKLKSNIFTIDLTNGLVIAQVPLPVPIKALTEFDQAWSTALAASNNFRAPSYSYGIREIYNQFRTPEGMKDVFPPFKGTAFLIGSQYYKTFDNKFFHFEGRCQYILASDFVDKNFTMVITYGPEGGSEVKKSISLTDTYDTITIQPDYVVTVNGRSSNLPISAGELKVEKTNDWISARGRGFSISCSTVRDVCMFRISGFFQGKTNGLLGTYNHESFDDLNSPSGQMVDSVEKMAAVWKLGQCDEIPLPVHSDTATSNAQGMCSSAFKGRLSTLRPCYGVVSPTNYQSTCESLSLERGYSPTRAVCTASYAYQKVCELYGAKVEDLDDCSTN